MIFVDTGFFIALFDKADALHTSAMKWSKVLGEPLVVTEYVLVEVVNHFSRRSVRARGHAIVENVKSDPNYTIVNAGVSLFAAGLALHRQRTDKNWSLTDCISFHVMEQHGIQRALAFDHHYEQAGFEALLRREPKTS